MKIIISKDLDSGEFVKFNVDKRFGIIILNRVERGNALTIEMLKNLKNAIEHCQNSDKIRGVILTGNGSSFTTGMDLGAIDGSDQAAVKDYEGTSASITKMLFSGKPVVCAINGKAMGDGVAYALCADYRVAVKDSYFQMPEIFSGIFPGGGTSVIMPKIVGIPWAKKILMFGEKVSSGKALEIGLIDEIVDSKEELMKSAREKARFLSTKQQAVLNAIKLCSNYFFDKNYNEAYEIEKEASAWYEHDDKEQFVRNFRKKFL